MQGKGLELRYKSVSLWTLGWLLGWLLCVEQLCYHICSSQATIFYFSDTIHFSARSLAYEMLRWAVLTDHCFVSGLLYSPMSGLSLKTLRFEDWCSHSVICRAVSDAQIGSSVFSLDRWWFRWIICMVMTQLIYCVMVIIALILIFVTCISI